MNDMRAIEEAVHEQSERQTRNFKTKKDVLNHERCQQIYQEIEEMLAEYELNCRLQDQLRSDLCQKVHKFRQVLRKAHTKCRKGSSTLNKDSKETYDGDEMVEDYELIVNYLDIINDFIKVSIPQEFSDYQYSQNFQNTPSPD